MSAYTRLPSLGAIARPMRPVMPVGKPWPVSFDHVFQPSADLYNPSSGPPLVNVQGSRLKCQMPAYTTFPSFGSIARSDAPLWSLTKSVWLHVLPPSQVTYTPRSWLGPKTSPSAPTTT